MCDVTVRSGHLSTRFSRRSMACDFTQFDPRSSEEIDAEYCTDVEKLPEHLAIDASSKILVDWASKVATVSTVFVCHVLLQEAPEWLSLKLYAVNTSC